MMKVYLKRVFVFLIITVLMLNTVFVQPAEANAAFLPAAAVGYTISALAMLGIVFAFNDYDDVIDGINTVVNKFISTKEDIQQAYNDLFDESDINEFYNTGTMMFTRPDLWNELVDWFVGGGAESVLEEIMPNQCITSSTGEPIALSVMPSYDQYFFGTSRAYYPVVAGTLYPVGSSVSIDVNGKTYTYSLIFNESASKWEFYAGGSNPVYTQTYYPKSSKSEPSMGFVSAIYNGVESIYLCNIDYHAGINNGLYARRVIEVGAIPSTLNPPWDVPEEVSKIPDTKTGSEGQEKEKERYLPYPKKWWQEKTGEEAIDDVIEGVGTGQIAVPGIDELVGSIDDAVPIEESMTWNMAKPEDFDTPDLTNVFPFCIPFDLIALVGALNARAEVPIFKIPVNMSFAGYQGEMVVDLSDWEPVARVIRWGTTIIFLLGLIIVTRKMIQG